MGQQLKDPKKDNGVTEQENVQVYFYENESHLPMQARW